MTGATHRVGGVVCALAGYTILEQKGMLISDVSPLLQLTVMYPFAIYGSTVSDLDHHWQSAPSKDIVSFCINKILHLTTDLRKRTGSKNPVLAIFDAKHRSWQTHSDLFLILMIILSFQAIGSSISGANSIIMKLVFTGFILGIISHLILDMLTPEGIWCTFSTTLSRVLKIKVPEKIHLVPKTKFFATGGTWEKLVRYLMWVISFILLIRILYGMSPYQINWTPY